MYTVTEWPSVYIRNSFAARDKHHWRSAIYYVSPALKRNTNKVCVPERGANICAFLTESSSSPSYSLSLSLSHPMRRWWPRRRRATWHNIITVQRTRAARARLANWSRHCRRRCWRPRTKVYMLYASDVPYTIDRGVQHSLRSVCSSRVQNYELTPTKVWSALSVRAWLVRSINFYGVDEAHSENGVVPCCFF